jgi:hypothetical protein
MLASRMNDLSLVVSDTNHASTGIVHLLLSIPETGIQFAQAILSLPKVLLGRVLRIILGVKERPGEKVVAAGNKGKGKAVRSPAKKRVTGGKPD